MSDELPAPGTVVDGAWRLEAQGVRVRFGVIQTPEPSERVKRTTSDDPAVWRPAVDELVEEIWPRSIIERHRQEGDAAREQRRPNV
jgi:hypothetical protein